MLKRGTFSSTNGGEASLEGHAETHLLGTGRPSPSRDTDGKENGLRGTKAVSTFNCSCPAGHELWRWTESPRKSGSFSSWRMCSSHSECRVTREEGLGLRNRGTHGTGQGKWGRGGSSSLEGAFPVGGGEGL